MTDLDVHGSSLVMMMLMLGIVGVLYADTFNSIGSGAFRAVGPIDSVALVSVLVAVSVLVCVRFLE